MARNLSANIFKAGDKVSPIANPLVKLIIRRYVDRIYYCQDPEDPSRKERAFFEREILASS